MADENSLYHEIRRLIAVRQAHTALQSKGEIEFVYAEKDAYPLAYLRSSGEERILVVINPADREVSFGCAHVPQETLYRFGGEIALKDGIMTVPAQMVGWFKI